MTDDRRAARRALHLVALCAFAIGALWYSRAVLGDPTTVVTFDPSADFPRQWERDAAKLLDFASSDLKRGVAQLSYAARALGSAPWDFFTGWMCFPVDGVAFGEHMLADGLLGVPAQALWNDPVATYNFVVALKPWIAAVGMYAVAYHWTGSWGAALLAGFLFGFHPLRLSDASHLSVVGNEWIPYILLFLDRLFSRRRWRDALALALFASIQTLSSMYVLLQYALIVGIYGLCLSWRHRATLKSIVPRLALVAVFVALTTVWALGPYLAARSLWQLPSRPGGFQAPPWFFWFGGRYFPGVCLSLLALLGLGDRLSRRTTRSDDPRLPLTVGLLVVAWFLFPIRVPWTSLAVPSLGELMHSTVPGVSAIRAPDKVFFAAVVSLAALAGYGFGALERWLGTAGRWIALAVLLALCAGEVFVPAVAARSFGAALPSASFRLRPPEANLAAVRDLPPGPVLDWPGNYNFLWVAELADYVMLSAYHQHRISTCKASFRTPAQFEVNRIAARLPDPDAMRELWALGFRSIIFHAQDDERVRAETDAILSALADSRAGPHLVPLSSGSTIRVARLEGEGPISQDLSTLAAAPISRLPTVVGAVGIPLGLSSSGVTFRHPEPVQPTELLVTWRKDSKEVQREVARGLLPLALAPGRRTDVVVKAAAPASPGRYEVTFALADDPARVLGVEEIAVMRAPPRAADAQQRGARRGAARINP